jgi:PAS domain S-box-containing protein
VSQDRDKTHEQLLEEIARLRLRLAEPEETIAAIRQGTVDAFVVQEPDGEAVYTLATTPLLRQLSLITDSLPVLIAYVDRHQRYQFNNRQYEAWFSRPQHAILGMAMVELLGEAAYATLRPHVEAALAGHRAEFVSWLRYSGAEKRCVRASYVPHVHDGEVLGFVSFVEDITESKRAEEALQLLADAGKLLSESLDLTATLDAATRLAVPVLADCCALDLAARDGGPSRRVVSRHGEPACRALPRDLERHPPAWDQDTLATRVLRSGEPALAHDLPWGAILGVGGAVAAAASPAVRVQSAMCVPLIAGGRTIGVWTFFHQEPGRLHHENDLRVASELAGRVASALDNGRLYREVQTANRAKDAFLAALSHELRTPLAPALAMVERLEAAADLPPWLRDGLNLIRRNIELEARLIDDLLDITRIARGKLELRSQRLDLRRVIRQALETCNEPALASHRVSVDLSPDDHRVTGDPTRLTQVFWNLLSNALKFTPAGGAITVRSTLEPAGGWVVVEVADTGAGIEAEDLPKIFDAFAQGRAGTPRRFGGLGLGLAISRTIVELHGGRLEAASKGRERGASFTVRLPLASAAVGTVSGGGEPAAERRRQTGAVAGTAAGGGRRGAEHWTAAEPGLRILLVDDHPDTAESMADLLTAMGHGVIVAGSVAASLAVAEDESFDLVISDLGLPDGHGSDLMRSLAARYRLRGIALSGYGMEDDIARSLAAGFALHLTKPVSLEILRAAIRQVSGSGEMGPGRGGREAAAEPDAEGA